MPTTLAPPPAWPIPVRSPEQTRRQQADTLNAQYPDALAWYAEQCGTWMAAPSGATVIMQAPTAAALAAQLHDHYTRMIPQTPRPAPARPTRRRTPGRDQPPAHRTARTRSAGGGSTPAASRGRHEASRRGGRFRRGVSWLGLVADAA